MSYRMNRRSHTETFGSTVGDRIRLGNTEFTTDSAGASF